jgi:hypothetical protein
MPRCFTARLKMSLDVGPICQRWTEERDKDKPGANMSLHMVGRGKRRKKILKSNKKVKIPQMDELHVLMVIFRKLAKLGLYSVRPGI